MSPLPWLARSLRGRLLAMALLPLAVALPLLVGVVVIWANLTYDRLLTTKVRSDLAVARGYFARAVADVGGGTEAVAASAALQRALAAGGPRPQANPRLAALLAAERQRLGLDFLELAPPADGPWPGQGNGAGGAGLAVLDGALLARIAPNRAGQVQVPLVPTRNAAPSDRAAEDRALVVLATARVMGSGGEPLALLRGGVLLNRNLDFIDALNQIVYPEGSLPFGSQGTATIFLEDVRVSTNVRLFHDERAIGTRVSQAVREAVLERGGTWLDRAFVVEDWYVSGYEPLADGQGRRIGMLYVGFLEQPFRLVKWAMLAAIVLLFAAVMALAAWLSLRWARGVFGPVERMDATMRRVEEGDAAARVGPVGADDELGALARHLDRLLDVVGDNTRRLDQQVAERTRELAETNASLRQAQQQLVKSEKLAAIGQLAASIAHEINNPIAVIQGNLDLVRDTLGPQAAPVRDELRLADEQVERMRRIVNQLLQYARPTEYAGYAEPLDAGQVFDECLVLAGQRLSQGGVEVVKDYAARQRVAFNRQELQQVLLNLIINALQAMGGAGRLTLSTRDQDGQVVLAVRDSGPGLPPGPTERLFRPFFTTRADGNGLGLWISLGLVQRYGGAIEAQDAPGGGALLRVLLPAEGAGPAAVPNS